MVLVVLFCFLSLDTTGPLFASNSCWQAKLPDHAPISPNSTSFVKSVVSQIQQYSPFINSVNLSVPIYVADDNETLFYVTLNSQKGMRYAHKLQQAFSSVPIPSSAHPADGYDHHLVILQPSTGKMWEFWEMTSVTNSSGVFWQAVWGGYNENYTNSLGFYSDPFPNWGATATSLMVAGGLILVSEAQSGVIPHALAFAMLDYAPWWVVVEPAQRSDGNAWGIVPEGTRFRFPSNSSFDSISNPFALLLATSIRDYGLIARDTSPVPVLYAEDPTPYGSDPWPAIFQDFENIMKEIPWQEMEVVDPSWAPWDPSSPWYQPTL